MNITKFVSTNIYLIMTLFICAISYIYVVNGLKCHIVLGVCSIGIEGIVSYSVYVVLLSVCKEGKTRHKPLKRKPINPKDTGKKPKPIITEERDVPPVQEINIKEKERQEAVTQCKEYIRRIVAQYFPEELMPQLLHLVEEYANGIIRCTPIMIAINDTKGLLPLDLESVDSLECLIPKSFMPFH